MTNLWSREGWNQHVRSRVLSSDMCILADVYGAVAEGEITHVKLHTMENVFGVWGDLVIPVWARWRHK